MNKKFIVKVFTVMTIVMVCLILLAGAFMFFTATTEKIKSISLGLMIGAAVGGVIGVKYKIKKRYADKDERTLVIGLLSNLISQTVFALASFVCFMLTAVGIITFDQINFDNKLLLYVFGIALLAVLVERVTNKVVSANM